MKVWATNLGRHGGSQVHRIDPTIQPLEWPALTGGMP